MRTVNAQEKGVTPKTPSRSARRAAAVVAILAPLVPLALTTAPSAQAQAGSRICARYGSVGDQLIARAVELQENAEDRCDYQPMVDEMAKGLTNVQRYWGTCEEFGSLVLRGKYGANPCESMNQYAPPRDDWEIHTFELT